jgi:uncharacterized protein YndB with AHSA1/START domain
MKHTDPPITVEQTFHTSTTKVWSAITQWDEMILWYFNNIPEFIPEVGFTTAFEVQSGDRRFPHKWRITEVIPHKKISYHWSYDNYQGEAIVSFELSELNEKTKLVLTNTILSDFPSNIPEFTTESCTQGWQYFIQLQLKNYLETKL